jgi:hypothetical protein
MKPSLCRGVGKRLEMTVARLLWTEWSGRRESNGSAALNKVRAYRKIRLKEHRVHFRGEARSQYQGGQHEKFSEVAAGARGDSDGRRWFKRTRVRARQRRSKYSGLAGLSAASPGIEAAIVTTRRATVLHPSTQGATSGSALTWPTTAATANRAPHCAAGRAARRSRTTGRSSARRFPPSGSPSPCLRPRDLHRYNPGAT